MLYCNFLPWLAEGHFLVVNVGCDLCHFTPLMAQPNSDEPILVTRHKFVVKLDSFSSFVYINTTDRTKEPSDLMAKFNKMCLRMSDLEPKGQGGVRSS